MKCIVKQKNATNSKICEKERLKKQDKKDRSDSKPNDTDMLGHVSVKKLNIGPKDCQFNTLMLLCSYNAAIYDNSIRTIIAELILSGLLYINKAHEQKIRQLYTSTRELCSTDKAGCA